MAARLSWDFDQYTPSNIKAMQEAGDTAKVRKEYTRLRDIARKRLTRLKAGGFEQTEAYQKNYKHYPYLKDIKSDSELAQRLSDLSRFIASKRTTIKGIKDIRSEGLKTLHEHGYKFVTDENYHEFTQFMEDYRNNMLDLEYDSGDAAELFGVAEKHKVDPEKIKADFEYWLENIDLAKKLRKSRQSTGNYAKLYKRLEQKTKKR